MALYPAVYCQKQDIVYICMESFHCWQAQFFSTIIWYSALATGNSCNPQAHFPVQKCFPITKIRIFLRGYKCKITDISLIYITCSELWQWSAPRGELHLCAALWWHLQYQTIYSHWGLMQLVWSVRSMWSSLVAHHRLSPATKLHLPEPCIAMAARNSEAGWSSWFA